MGLPSPQAQATAVAKLLGGMMEKRRHAMLASDRRTLHVEVNEAQWQGRRASQ